MLNYKSFGSGPALIILHGLFGSLDNWQTLARMYAEEFSVYIVDQRNHGKSPHSDDAYTYSLLANDLLEFMDAQGMYSAYLIGHSMGGKVVMQFAAEHDDRVERMVVADMAPRAYPPHHTVILKTLADFPFNEITTRKAADEWLAGPIPDFGTRQFLLKNLVRAPQGGFRYKFHFDVLHRDYAHILDAVHLDYPVETPTLFLRGGKSEYVLDDYWPDIQAQFPNASLDTIADAGHWVHAEAPQAFFEKTKAFLL